MQRSELRDAAYEKTREMLRAPVEPNNRILFYEGFNAGYDATLSENAWVAVEDRLPEAEGFYLVYSDTARHSLKVWQFDKSNEANQRMWQTMAVAWMPIPPYIPQEKKK